MFHHLCLALNKNKVTVSCNHCNHLQRFYAPAQMIRGFLPLQSSLYSPDHIQDIGGTQTQGFIISIWRLSAKGKGLLGSCDVTQMGDRVTWERSALQGEERGHMKNNQICKFEGRRGIFHWHVKSAQIQPTPTVQGPGKAKGPWKKEMGL